MTILSINASVIIFTTSQLTDDVEVRHNGYSNNDVSGRSDAGILETVENYVQSHDVTFGFPIAGAKVTVSPRNINDEELNLKIKFTNEGRSVAEARKSKLKKIFIPILVFVLLKAITLIPLALGVLGLKAWNSLQLSFFSFIVSVALAIFQLCKKVSFLSAFCCNFTQFSFPLFQIASDNHHPQIAAHGPWDAGRSYVGAEPLPEFNANLPYNAYA